MRIITISREFGSGGRELGKRVADILGFQYYDREVVSAISQSKGLDADYVERALDRPAGQRVPGTFRHSLFSRPCHCEPVRRLVWQSPGFSGNFPNFSQQKISATE